MSSTVESGDGPNWYAVRALYHFGTKDDGTNVFEERVVVFVGGSPEEAFAKAEVEAVTYAGENDFDLHPEMSSYRQDGEALIDGYEVWSELFEAPLDLEGFYAERYGRFEYDPSPPGEGSVRDV